MKAADVAAPKQIGTAHDARLRFKYILKTHAEHVNAWEEGEN
jgi:hypothetical protein